MPASRQAGMPGEGEGLGVKGQGEGEGVRVHASIAAGGGMPVPRFCALMPTMGRRLWSIMPGEG